LSGTSGGLKKLKNVSRFSSFVTNFGPPFPFPFGFVFFLTILTQGFLPDFHLISQPEDLMTSGPS